MKLLFYSCLLFCMISATNAAAQSAKPVNYLNTGSDISFNGTKFILAWSSHPTALYYKQEYLPTGQSPEKFTDMLMMEVVSSSLTHKDAYDAKVAELTSLKRTDPYVNFETFYHKESNEYLLDFVITANAVDGKTIQVAERNVYRYKKYSGSKGETGVLLFAVSKRSYGAAAAGFVKGITGETRKDLADKVKRFAFPSITLR
ncbi:MAG: hypothetical protein ABW007_19955 [Chitinophagaceae bacterium]